MGQPAFPRLREARELLISKARDIIDNYMNNASEARVAGQHDVAAKSYEFLMLHMPKDELGETIVDATIDKARELDSGSKGPTINIGVVLGGLGKPVAALPESTIIEVEPVEPEPLSITAGPEPPGNPPERPALHPLQAVPEAAGVPPEQQAQPDSDRKSRRRKVGDATG